MPGQVLNDQALLAWIHFKRGGLCSFYLNQYWPIDPTRGAYSEERQLEDWQLATGKKMQQTEVMEKSKEELMEELMAKLKEDLAKGRKQVAAKEDTVESYVNISHWISNICRHSEL